MYKLILILGMFTISICNMFSQFDKTINDKNSIIDNTNVPNVNIKQIEEYNLKHKESIITIDGKKYKFDSVISKSFDNNFIDSYKTEYNYDERGNLIYNTNLSLVNIDTWSAYAFYYYKYNEQNQIISYEAKRKDWLTDSIIGTSHYLNNFDNEGRKIFEQNHKWDTLNSKWINTS